MDKINSLQKRIKSIEWRTRNFPYAIGSLAIVSVLVFGSLTLSYSPAPGPKPKDVSAFRNIRVSAKSVVVWDALTNEVLYEKNADDKRPLASLTKIMTALTAAEEAKNLNEVTVDEADLATEGESGLVLGSKWDIKSLIDYSLLVSSNDGMSAIAASAGSLIGNTSRENGKAVFIEKMNSLAAQLGLNQSKFINEHGLDQDANHVGAYGSARDMVKLFDYILENHPEILEPTKYDSLTIRDQSGDIYNAENTNLAANFIPSLLASKTGFTDLAGGNLVVAFDAGLNHPVIISVLGSTKEGRFEDAILLADTTIKYLQNN